MSLEEPIPEHRLVGEPVTRPDGVRILIALRRNTQVATEVQLLNPPRIVTHFYGSDEAFAIGEGDVQVAVDRIMQALYRCNHIESHDLTLSYPDHSCK